MLLIRMFVLVLLIFTANVRADVNCKADFIYLDNEYSGVPLSAELSDQIKETLCEQESALQIAARVIGPEYFLSPESDTSDVQTQKVYFHVIVSFTADDNGRFKTQGFCFFKNKLIGCPPYAKTTGDFLSGFDCASTGRTPLNIFVGPSLIGNGDREFEVVGEGVKSSQCQSDFKNHQITCQLVAKNKNRYLLTLDTWPRREQECPFCGIIFPGGPIRYKEVYFRAHVIAKTKALHLFPREREISMACKRR